MKVNLWSSLDSFILGNAPMELEVEDALPTETSGYLLDLGKTKLLLPSTAVVEMFEEN